MTFVNTIMGKLTDEPRKAFLVEVQGKTLVTCTGAEIRQLIDRARASVRASGVKPGDRVAILAPNSARWVAADLAVIAEGGISVPLYSRQDPHQLAGMLKDCTPSLLMVADQELEEAIRSAWPDACRIVRFEEVFAAEPIADPFAPLEAQSPITIIYTSGTSGEPKGAILTVANIDFMLPRTAAKLDQATGHRPPNDRFFHYLPLCFAASRIACWSQLYRGNPVFLSTDLNKLVDEIAAVDPHYFLNVPALLVRIKSAVEQRVQERGGVALKLYTKGVEAYRHVEDGQSGAGDQLWLTAARKLAFAKIKKTIGPSLEFLICGSAPLSEETQRWFHMIGIPVYQAYGLTETTGIVSMDNPTAEVKPGRVGCAIDGCEARVTEEGELLCRGPNIFGGYWNRPEATDDVLSDGWFHTGDQVEMAEDGSLQIVGRLKDLLVPESGHNVAPEPLERKLMEASHGVEQAVVVGHGKPFLAAIVTGPADDAELEAVRQRLNAGLPHYQRIQKLFHAPEPFTVENQLLTANQKLRRRAIEQRYRDAIAGLYAS